MKALVNGEVSDLTYDSIVRSVVLFFLDENEAKESQTVEGRIQTINSVVGVFSSTGSWGLWAFLKYHQLTLEVQWAVVLMMLIATATFLLFMYRMSKRLWSCWCRCCCRSRNKEDPNLPSDSASPANASTDATNKKTD